MRCRHEPRVLYVLNRQSLAVMVLAPHRAQDWRVCVKCGHVGLASKRTGKVHWRSYADPELVAKAQRWNEWAAKQD